MEQFNSLPHFALNCSVRYLPGTMNELLTPLALDPGPYSIAIQIFLRLLGLIYLFAYVPFLFQIRGLLGKDGILPVSTFLHHVQQRFGARRFYYLPTVLWINSSDAALFGLIWAGILLGALLLLGIGTSAVLLLLYLVHLSLTSAGQDFLGFGWETLLLEITAAACLMTATTPYNVFGWIGLNFILLRFHLQAGASKLLSGDSTWRDFTALKYHYLTQPIPNLTAWYFHKLPLWVHRLGGWTTFYFELIVPLAIFSPPLVRLLVAIQLIGLQGLIWLTGNLSYLNHMTAALCVILIHNRYLEPWLGSVGAVPAVTESSSYLWQGFISVLALAFLMFQIINLCHYFFPRRAWAAMLQWISPFHLAHPHQLFSVMTTQRQEIVIEGSDDGEEWCEYQFYFKPGDVARPPGRISPFQPRLDWQAWFLPFAGFDEQWWFQRFLIKLLQGSRPVLGLLKENPFPDHPPKYVRVLLYDYIFTTRKERKETGHWWKRTLLGTYAGPMNLRK